MRIERVLLAAGGTGGHIWPAISFGQWINEEHPEVSVDYICGNRELELEIYRSADIEPHKLNISGSPLGVKGFKRLTRCRELCESLAAARRLVKKLSPSMCVTFGGYASAPALFACLATGTPVVAHEQNAAAGRLTLLASRLSIPVVSGWHVCGGLKEGAFTPVGVPIRRFKELGREEALARLAIPAGFMGSVTVGVMAGSLGSTSLQEIILQLSEQEEFKSWRFIILDPRSEGVTQVGDGTILLPKTWDIAPLYEVSDILIVRGGASTLAEAEWSGKPTLVVPWRNAAQDHQMKNAELLTAIGAADIWDEKNDTIADFGKKMRTLGAKCSRDRVIAGRRLYNLMENSCEKLWNAVSNATKGEIRFEGK